MSGRVLSLGDASHGLFEMKHIFLLPLGVLVAANPYPAHALDCAKASSPIEKLFCATPELKKADEEMSAAYFKLVRETKNPDFREGLIRSQRRWLVERSKGPERFGAAEGDKTDDREILLHMTRDRQTFLQNAEPIRTMEQQRKIASQDGGGRFAGYRSDCMLEPPPYAGWSYSCWGEAHRQHGDKICSVGMEWASGHITERRFVRVIENDLPKIIASCSTGYTSTTEECPDPDNDSETAAVAHWNTTPALSDGALAPPPGGFWKYDPDIVPSIVDRPWMHDCLFSPNYPPLN
jgi:uncharacterized protein YecT (DUF1311 family)